MRMEPEGRWWEDAFQGVISKLQPEVRCRETGCQCAPCGMPARFLPSRTMLSNRMPACMHVQAGQALASEVSANSRPGSHLPRTSPPTCSTAGGFLHSAVPKCKWVPLPCRRNRPQMCRRRMISPAAAAGPRTRMAHDPLLARMSCAWQQSFIASLPGTAAADSPAGEHCMATRPLAGTPFGSRISDAWCAYCWPSQLKQRWLGSGEACFVVAQLSAEPRGP